MNLFISCTAVAHTPMHSLSEKRREVSTPLSQKGNGLEDGHEKVTFWCPITDVKFVEFHMSKFHVITQKHLCMVVPWGFSASFEVRKLNVKDAVCDPFSDPVTKGIRNTSDLGLKCAKMSTKVTKKRLHQRHLISALFCTPIELIHLWPSRSAVLLLQKGKSQGVESAKTRPQGRCARPWARRFTFSKKSLTDVCVSLKTLEAKTFANEEKQTHCTENPSAKKALKALSSSSLASSNKNIRVLLLNLVQLEKYGRILACKWLWKPTFSISATFPEFWIWSNHWRPCAPLSMICPGSLADCLRMQRHLWSCSLRERKTKKTFWHSQ